MQAAAGYLGRGWPRDLDVLLVLPFADLVKSVPEGGQPGVAPGALVAGGAKPVSSRDTGWLCTLGLRLVLA